MVYREGIKGLMCVCVCVCVGGGGLQVSGLEHIIVSPPSSGDRIENGAIWLKVKFKALAMFFYIYKTVHVHDVLLYQ